MIPAMIETNLVVDVLGGRKVIGQRVRSQIELIEVIERGFPKETLRNVAARALDDPAARRKLIFQVVPEATYKRRRERLSKAESERTERLARVIAIAEYVWDDHEDMSRFLTTPHPELGGRAPLAACATELGGRQVESVLTKIFHGLPA